MVMALNRYVRNLHVRAIHGLYLHVKGWGTRSNYHIGGGEGGGSQNIVESRDSAPPPFALGKQVIHRIMTSPQNDHYRLRKAM